MISMSSVLASSAPATSRKVTFGAASFSTFARLLPNEKMPRGPAPCMRRMMMNQTTRRSTQGRAPISALTQALSSFCTEKRTP